MKKIILTNKEGVKWEFLYRKTAPVFQSGGGTKQLEQRLAEIEQSQATGENYGFVMLSGSTGVNKSDGLALPTSEKNPAKPGTIAYEQERMFAKVWKNMGTQTVDGNSVFRFSAQADVLDGYTPFSISGVNINWPACFVSDFSLQTENAHGVVLSGLNVSPDPVQLTPFVEIVYKKNRTGA